MLRWLGPAAPGAAEPLPWLPDVAAIVSPLVALGKAKIAPLALACVLPVFRASSTPTTGVNLPSKSADPARESCTAPVLLADFKASERPLGRQRWA